MFSTRELATIYGLGKAIRSRERVRDPRVGTRNTTQLMSARRITAITPIYLRSIRLSASTKRRRVGDPFAPHGFYSKLYSSALFQRS